MRILLLILLTFFSSCGVDTVDTSNDSYTDPLARSRFGLYNPLPSGTIAGYKEDSGLDILANRKPTFAVASGTLLYSERGHTSWTSGNDTPYSVLMKLDNPIRVSNGRHVTHIYYTHLSKLAFDQPLTAKKRQRVKAGQYLGLTGLGNNVPHLHIGFLLDNVTSQSSESTYLSFTEIRSMLGSYKHGEVLPKQ